MRLAAVMWGTQTEYVLFSFFEAQKYDKMLVGGLLSDSDVTAEYMSPSSGDFRPLIVDPALTKNKTDRFMRSR